jgi:hypothetical protein
MTRIPDAGTYDASPTVRFAVFPVEGYLGERRSYYVQEEHRKVGPNLHFGWFPVGYEPFTNKATAHREARRRVAELRDGDAGTEETR